MANEFKVKKGLIVDGSGTVVDIQGTAGQLFSVTDSLTGDLFSVSDVSGVPILNVNSSGTVEVDGTLNVNSSSTLVIDGTVDSNIVMPTAGDQIRIGTFTDGSSNSGEYANDDIVIGEGGSISIFPHRRGDYGLNETGNTSTTFRSKLNIWSDNQDHITFGGAHTKIRTAWEHFHLWINNDSADAGLFRLYNKSSETEFARLAGEGSSFVLENFRVKQTADTGFNSGLTVERSANTQKVHIGMDGGAVNFNSPDGLSYKFRNNGTETFTLNGSGYGIISNRLQVGKAGGAGNSGRLDLFGRYSGDKPRIFFKTDHPSDSTQWDMAQIYAGDGGNFNGQLYFQVASGNGSSGSAASLATALFIDDTKDATFYGNISTDYDLILGVPSNGNAVNKLTIASGTNGDGIFLTGLGTSAGMGTGNYRAIDFQYSNTDASFQSAIRFVVPDSTIHGGQIEFWTDDSNGLNTKALTLDKSQNATLTGNVLKIEGASPYIRGTGTGAMRIKHTAGQTMYIRPDETGSVSFFEGANSQTVHMMTVAPSTNNTQNNSAKLAFQTRSKQSDGQNNSKTAIIQHETYDIGNNYGNLNISGTNKTTFSDMDVIITDNKALMLGTGGDAFIKHTGTHLYMYNDTGAINFVQRVNDGNIVFTNDDGNGGTFDYFTVDGGSTTYANGATTAAYTKWQDKSRIALGSDKDLQLYHDGANSYIETSTSSAGDLYIKAQGTNHDLYLQAVDDIFIRPQGGENGIYVQGNGGVSLYHDNTVRISTADFGATINGTGEFGVSTYRTYVYGSGSGSFITFGTTLDNDSLGSMGTYGSAMMFETNQGLGFKWKTGGTERASLTTGGVLTASSFTATATDAINLASTAFIDWANGDARIIEGEVGGYSLSFEIYNGSSALERVMLLEKDKTATFYGGVEIDSSYSSGSTVFDVQGSEGQLFSVTNSLSGDLFSVSDVSGIPILNINSSGAITFDGYIPYGNKLNFGSTSSGLEIYSDSGSNSYIKETGGSGALVFQSNHYYFQDNSNNTRVNINAANGNSEFSGMVTTASRFNASTQALHFPNYTGSQGWQIGSDSTAAGMYIYNENGVYAMKLTNVGEATFAGELYLPSYIRHIGDSDTYFGFSGDNAWKVRSGGVDRLSVTGDVNVNSTTDLNINGTSRRINFTSGSGTIKTTTSNALYFDTNNTTALTIASDQHSTFSGQVSVHHIDTTSTTANIFLGSVICKPPNSSGFILRNSSNGIIGQLRKDSDSVSYLSCTTVQTTGNIGNLDTTNDIGQQLEVGDANAATLRCDANRWRVYMGGAGNSQETLTVVENGRVGVKQSSPSYPLDVTGTFRATGDVIAFSDERVKENIKTIDNSLEKVNKLRGVEFNKIGEDKKSIGVIAQEIEKILPEVVHSDGDGMKSVAYGNIVGVLIEAVKELTAEVEELKKQIK